MRGFAECGVKRQHNAARLTACEVQGVGEVRAIGIPVKRACDTKSRALIAADDTARSVLAEPARYAGQWLNRSVAVA